MSRQETPKVIVSPTTDPPGTRTTGLEQKAHSTSDLVAYTHDAAVIEEFGPIVRRAAKKAQVAKTTKLAKKEYDIHRSYSPRACVNWFVEKEFLLLQEAAEVGWEAESLDQAVENFYARHREKYGSLIREMIADIVQGN